jgi:hypothetical protein
MLGFPSKKSLSLTLQVTCCLKMPDAPILSTIIYILNNYRAHQKPIRSILLIMKKLKEDIIFEALQ